MLTLVLMVVNGLRFGGMAYIKHFCPGPLWLFSLLVPVEIIGLFAKTFALAVRLFANMIAGHILLGVLLGLIFSPVRRSAPAPVSRVTSVIVVGSVAITLLEVFVAFLQAFIFAFLTALFIGMSVNVHHDDHDAHAEDGAGSLIPSHPAIFDHPSDHERKLAMNRKNSARLVLMLVAVGFVLLFAPAAFAQERRR